MAGQAAAGWPCRPRARPRAWPAGWGPAALLLAAAAARSQGRAGVGRPKKKKIIIIIKIIISGHKLWGWGCGLGLGWGRLSGSWLCSPASAVCCCPGVGQPLLLLSASCLSPPWLWLWVVVVVSCRGRGCTNGLAAFVSCRCCTKAVRAVRTGCTHRLLSAVMAGVMAHTRPPLRPSAVAVPRKAVRPLAAAGPPAVRASYGLWLKAGRRLWPGGLRARLAAAGGCAAGAGRVLSGAHTQTQRLPAAGRARRPAGGVPEGCARGGRAAGRAAVAVAAGHAIKCTNGLQSAVAGWPSAGAVAGRPVTHGRPAPCPHAPHPRHSAALRTLRRAVRASPRWKPMSKHAPTARMSWSGWPLMRRRARIASPRGFRRVNNLP